MNEFKKHTKSFLNGYYYPLLVFAIALISHTFSIEPLGIFVIIASSCVGFLVCDDVKFFISPLIFFILMFSQKSVESGIFFTIGYIIAIIIAIITLFGFIVAHNIIYRKSKDFRGFLKSKLFWGFSVFSIALLLNGFFNFDEYVVGNFTFAIALVVSFVGIFFLFRTGLNSSDSLKDYLFYVLFLLSCLVTLQFYISFITQIEFFEGEIVKESILLGWGMWNNVGGMLAFLLPTHFYLAATKKRGYLFLLSGIISYFAIVLCLSRSSLIVSTLAVGISIIISCFKGNNKKINRIATGAIAIGGIIFLIVFWSKISSVLGDYLARGLDDNGRFDIYRRGWEKFLDNPVFGGGFHSAVAQEHTFIAFLPDRYHNTVIQLLGTTGIVGLIAYIFHRYQTIVLMWKKRSLHTAFFAICISSFLLTSLLDNHLFNIYPCFIYSIIFAVLDVSKE